jgi:hypothetical protein
MRLYLKDILLHAIVNFWNESQTWEYASELASGRLRNLLCGNRQHEHVGPYDRVRKFYLFRFQFHGLGVLIAFLSLVLDVKY